MSSADILDAETTRPISGGPSFSFASRIERAVWGMVWLTLARWTPAMFSPWRIWLLKRFGAQIAPGAAIGASATVWLPRHLHMAENASLAPRVTCYNMAPIHIGRNTIVSQGAHLCAGSHDVGSREFQLIAKPIHIGNDVWIAAESFVAPGVTIEDGVVLAARACAFEDLNAWTIYRGNPAVAIRARRWRDEGGGPR